VGIGFVKVKLIHGLKIKAAEFFAFFQEGLGLFRCQKERVVWVEGFLGIQVRKVNVQQSLDGAEAVCGPNFSFKQVVKGSSLHLKVFGNM
jgi:hypothetical protein